MNKEKGKIKIEFDKLNEYFNDSIKELKPSKYPLVGRFDHLHNMSVMMERPDTPIAVLLAEAGAGKTASMQAWKAFEEKRVGHKIHVLTLNVGKLSANGDNILQDRIESLIPRLKEYQQTLQEIDPKTYIVLFIDEIHMLVSIFKDSKIGGDLLKRSLTEEPIRTIGATTLEEYNNLISLDDALERRLKPIRMKKLNSDEVLQVLRSRLISYISKEYSDTIDDEVLKNIIRSSRIYRPRFTEPAQSIDVLETMVAYYKVDDREINFDLIETVFKVQYNIETNPKEDVKNTEAVLLKRIKGQPLAVYTALKMIKSVPYRLGSKNRPMSALLAGTTGTGKTELVKSITEGLEGDEENLFIMNMPDFKLKESEPEFRRILGERVYNYPRSKILFDEFEKAHDDVKSALLPILDEGVVSYTKKGIDGFTTSKKESLRNCYLFFTTNAGAELLDKDNKYSNVNRNMTKENMNEISSQMRREWRQLAPELNDALIADGFKPELLGRFDNIIPFKSLSEATLLTIAENKINDVVIGFYEQYGISLKYKPPKDWTNFGYEHITTELAMYIVMERGNQIDSKSGGARNIKRIIKSDIEEEVVETIYEYPNETTFMIVTDGNSSFEDQSKLKGEGAIEVIPEMKYSEREKVS